jgi:hypothetical protein
LVALGVSALGKKRHRVDIARRLVVGSLVGNFERRKQILYPADDTAGKGLLRVLDSSLPWWTERDTWGRWTVKRALDNGLQAATSLPFFGESLKLQLARSDGHVEYKDPGSTMTLLQMIQQLLSDREQGGSKRQFRVTAMLQPFALAIDL